MIENLTFTKKAFADATTFEDLIDNLTTPLSKRLGGGNGGYINAILALHYLASLNRRFFSFEQFRFETRQFDAECLESKEEVGKILNAIRSLGIIYTTPQGKNIIKPRFYRKLSRLAHIYDEQQAEELMKSLY